MDNPRNGRQDRVARFGLLGNVVPSLVVLLVAIFILRLALASSGEGRQATLVTLGVAVGLTFAVYGSAAIWNLGTLLRNRRIRVARPGSLILGGVRSRELVEAVPRLGKDLQSLDHSVPLSLSLTFSSQSVEMWTGWGRPEKVFSFEWKDVEQIRFVEIAELGRRSRGIELAIRSDPGTTNVPFIVTGRGPAGLFPETEAHLVGYAQEAEALRPKA